MTSIEIPRELAEKLVDAANWSGSTNEVRQLQALLNPKPVMVRDFVEAGRGDEIKPGMWVEAKFSGTLFILRDVGTNTCEAFNTGWGEDNVFAGSVKPRFDLRPAFAPDGMPFPIEDVEPEPEPEPEQPETPETGLFGRWATHPEHGRVLVTWNKADTEGEIRAHWMGENEVLGNYDYVPLSSLTFDPATLTTEQEYADAPDGTIVERKKGLIFVKDGRVWWRRGEDYNNDDLCCVTRKIVRWGRG